jgi:thymidylate synthase ThyX
MKIQAKILADSISERGDRITTYLLTFPRIILAEFNTHRSFSRNSASSRAIPFKKMVESVEKNPFIPIAWQKDHKGMQGTEYLTEQHHINYVRALWLSAAEEAIQSAKCLHSESAKVITKQICNRLLEPFMWHTVICTATDYDNFFKLRDHEAAEIHIQELAKKMKEAMNESTPKVLGIGEWHIPFANIISHGILEDEVIFKDPYWKKVWIKPNEVNPEYEEYVNGLNLKIATAKCARVSYTTVGSEYKTEYRADIELYNKLLESGHMSPFEHCAQVMSETDYYERPWSRNFKGFKQYREIVETTPH